MNVCLYLRLPILCAYSGALLPSQSCPLFSVTLIRARLQACSQKESGVWLTAPPISSLGLWMCIATIRSATSLRLGAHLCAPHDCTHCGKRVDETGLHGLSCRRSTGRLSSHNQLNTIIKQSLTSANIPSVLEPQGLFPFDGKHPDGDPSPLGPKAVSSFGMPHVGTQWQLPTSI